MLKRAVMTSVSAAALVTVLLVVAPAGADNERRLHLPATSDHFRFGDTVIDEATHGSVQVLGGSVRVTDVITGDLLVVGGDVAFEGDGRVTGNLVHAGGSVTGAGDRVGGQTYPFASMDGAVTTLTRSAVMLALLLGWLIVAVILTLAAGRELRYSSTEIRVSALHCFALGLVAFTSFILTAVMFSYLVPYFVGIPLLVALGVFAILTKVYGMIAVFHAVGTLVAGARTREQLASRRWLRGDLAMVVIGLLLLGALRMIPVVGPIIWSAASIFGIGVALATRFGRREPWFLVWRPAY